MGNSKFNMTFSRSIFLMLLLSAFSFTISAQVVDTVAVYSKKMNKDIKNVIILPASYSQNKSFPVLYLLHGHGGNYSTWINHTKKNLAQKASELNMIVVCPDGQNSWFWDSPIDPSMQFETYISKELVSYIDAHYRTIKSPFGRAITGFSMGGHGGLWLGIRHPDIFGACGSMSGGVDIRPFPNSWDMKKRLGNYKENTEVWNAHTVITQLDKIEPGQLKIIIDCGESDFFYPVNERLHKELQYRNIEHDYIIRPGSHNHPYWNTAADYQMLFFNKFFNSPHD